MIRIGPGAPESERDFLVLQLARARADALLTTAQILRAEPGLTLDFGGPFAGQLADYRKALGKHALTICIITLKGDVPLEHPIWNDGAHKLVYTQRAHATALAQALLGRAEVVAADEPSPQAALAELTRRGARAISVEAGPSAAGTLYAPPWPVAELWLSRVEIPDLDEALLGPALPPDDVLFRGMQRMSSVLCTEHSGPFRFERWLRHPHA